MTKKHARYLKNYPEKTALKRRKRRIKARFAKVENRVDRSIFRSALAEYLLSKKERTNDKQGTIFDKIKGMFKRKPSV